MPRMARAPAAHRSLQALRRLCRSLADVTETQAWGHPNFNVGGKTFAAFEVCRGRPSIAVKVEPGFGDLLTDGDRYFRTPYGGGRWVSAWVDGAVDWALVKDMVRRAHALAAPRRRSRTRARQGG